MDEDEHGYFDILNTFPFGLCFTENLLEIFIIFDYFLLLMPVPLEKPELSLALLSLKLLHLSTFIIRLIY